MRRAVTVFLFVMLGVTFGVDGMCCPDGCTRQAPHAASPSGQHSDADGACVFCQGAAVPPADPPVPLCAVIGSIVTSTTPAPADGVFGVVEHPPRC